MPRPPSCPMITGRCTSSGWSSSSTEAKNASMSTCSTVARELSTSAADTCRSPSPPFAATTPFSLVGTDVRGTAIVGAPTADASQREGLHHLQLEGGRIERVRRRAAGQHEAAAAVGLDGPAVQLVHLEPQLVAVLRRPALDAGEQRVGDARGGAADGRRDVDRDERRRALGDDAGHGADPAAVLQLGDELHAARAAAGDALPVRDRMRLRGLQRLEVGDRGVREHLEPEGAHPHPVALLHLAHRERGHRTGSSTGAAASARSSAGMRKPSSSTAFSTVKTDGGDPRGADQRQRDPLQHDRDVVRVRQQAVRPASARAAAPARRRSGCSSAGRACGCTTSAAPARRARAPAPAPRARRGTACRRAAARARTPRSARCAARPSAGSGRGRSPGRPARTPSGRSGRTRRARRSARPPSPRAGRGTAPYAAHHPAVPASSAPLMPRPGPRPARATAAARTPRSPRARARTAARTPCAAWSTRSSSASTCSTLDDDRLPTAAIDAQLRSSAPTGRSSPRWNASSTFGPPGCAIQVPMSLEPEPLVGEERGRVVREVRVDDVDDARGQDDAEPGLARAEADHAAAAGVEAAARRDHVRSGEGRRPVAHRRAAPRRRRRRTARSRPGCPSSRRPSAP